MLKFKDGVPLGGLQPDMLYAIDKCNDVFNDRDYDCIVTSTTDGKHMKNSKHPLGFAGDLRRYHIQTRDIEHITHELKSSLGKNYDVILEIDHWHVEFDPKD